WLQGLDWLPDVLNGYAQEPFVGLVLRGTHESVAGGLEGIWWVLFVLVDAGLFAYLFLVGTTLGYFPAESVSADADSSADDNGDGP
ncbi:MAG TPA: hypothetical protein PKM88_05735, partial [bacterium]|nr:hypothetical protein [bacterium]